MSGFRLAGERFLGSIVVGSVYKAVSHPAPIVIDESCPRRSIEMASKVPCDTLDSRNFGPIQGAKELAHMVFNSNIPFCGFKLFDTRK